MGPYKRNWFVGGTVLLALITLAFLIIMFGGSLGSFFAGEKIHVTFRSDRADGLSEGSAIRYLGQNVGTVKNVTLILDQQPNYVVISAEIDKAIKLRRDMVGNIRIPGVLGSASIIELDLPAKPGTKANEFLTGGEEIPTSFVGLSIFPSEYGDLAGEIRGAVKEFREANVVGDFRTALNNFNAQVTKAGNVMDSINAVLGTPEAQTDLKTAIAKAREAVEHANAVTANFEKISNELKTMPAKLDATVTDVQAGVTDARATIKLAQDRIVTVSDQLNRNLDKIAAVLDDARSISDKINKGDGTLARLLNDPKLYETIVTMTEVINETVKDVQRLVRGIEQEGFPINLK
jgi:phospholipid/cholesterol/gamma-HCH transport system substrate-binding protein